jgi:uncharacterized membrane protein YfcA
VLSSSQHKPAMHGAMHGLPMRMVHPTIALPRGRVPSLYLADDPTAYAVSGLNNHIRCSIMTSMISLWSSLEPLQFMLPTSIAVATACQLSGIGGAALFSPIFLLGFPLLGPEYPLDSAAAAIASALLTEVFGFSSGLSGYARRGLVAWPVVGKFATISVPLAFVGALCASTVASSPGVLRTVYSLLMLSLAGFLLFAPPAESLAALSEEECAVDDTDGAAPQTVVAADGKAFTYRPPSLGGGSIGVTASGSFLTGLLGVGVGEVLLPQLVRSCCMPLPLAAGTSVATVVFTAAAAALVQFATLAALSADGDFASVVPWSLVRWTIPGVLIGGQCAPLIASRGWLSDATIERFAATLFTLVGLAFLLATVG